MHDYSQYVANTRDENGSSLLSHAIRMNDGGNVAALIKFGADIDAQVKNGSDISNYEYAKKYATYEGRQPYAFDAIDSFKKIRDTLKVGILYDHKLKVSEEYTKSLYESAKNKNDDEIVSLYHGAKTFSINEKVAESFFQAFTGSNCLQQISGPTLSINPIGQYWLGLGLEVKIPRSQVEFAGEKKVNPIIKINEDGIAFINTSDRKIKFDEFHTNILLNLRSTTVEKEVVPTYGEKEGNYAVKFDLDDKTINKLNEIQDFMEINHDKIFKKSSSFQIQEKSNSISNIDKMRQSQLNTESSFKPF